MMLVRSKSRRVGAAITLLSGAVLASGCDRESLGDFTAPEVELAAPSSPSQALESRVKVHGTRKGKFATTNPMIVIDGKRSTLSKFESIDPKDIADIRIINEPEELKEYGRAARGGVILIRMKGPRTERGSE